MLKIYNLLFLLSAICWHQEGFGQISISGQTNCIIPGREYLYTASGNWSGTDVPQMQWCAPGIINGESYCKTGVLQIKVIYDSTFSSGSISLWAPSGSVAINVSKDAGLLKDGNSVSPGNSIAFTNTTPETLMAAYPEGGTCEGDKYVFQWESATSISGPFSSIPGSNQQRFIPPASATEKILYFRRKVTHNSSSAYTGVAQVTYKYEPVSGGSLYYHEGGGRLPYGEKITVLQIPGRGWQCEQSGITYKWFYKKAPGGPEVLLGTGESFPETPALTVTTSDIYIRREATCGTESASSNELIFTTEMLDPGSIFTDDTVAVSGVRSQILQSAASGGRCAQDTYQYTWQQSTNGTTWQNIGGGKEFPITAPAFTTNMYIRRQVTCSNETKYSNILQFKTFPEDYLADNRSYIATTQVLTKGIKTWAGADTLSIGNKQRTTSFYDGLGRPAQTVAQMAGGEGKDLVQMNEYDAFGREEKKYLPFSYQKNDIKSSASNGKFKVTANATQAGFYNTLYPGEPAYANTVYELSPLNRELKVLPPGISWVGSNKGMGRTYQINIPADEVRIWNLPAGTFPVPVSSKTYPQGMLTKKVVTNEHGIQEVTFSNKDGQIVLTKKQLASAATLGNSHNGWYCTYQIYDNMGRLRVVIPPKATEIIKSNWILDTAVLNNLCFQYQYDNKSRMIRKKLPGAAPVDMVYDNRDRLVFIQDGNLFNKGQWHAIFYDELNRPIMTALYNKQISRQSLQNSMNSAAGNMALTQTIPLVDDIVVAVYDGRAVYKAAGSVTFESGFDSRQSQMETILGAENTSLTVTPNMPLPGISDKDLYPLTYQFYDNYTFADKKEFISGELSSLENGDNPVSPEIVTTYNSMVKGIPTGKKIRIIGTNQWLTSTAYYDMKNRPLQTLTENMSGGTDIISNRYDFSGKVLSTFVHHQNLRSGIIPEVKMLTINSYDKSGNLLSIKKKLNGEPTSKPIVQLTYNALGQVISRVLGSSIHTEQIDYNIRGWLTGVNRKYVSKQQAGFFGYELGYDKSTTIVSSTSYLVPAFNGNIAGAIWRGTGDQFKYDYAYDNADRLLKADFMANTGGAWNKNIDFSVKMGDGVNPLSAYDANGNILKMVQNGLKAGQSAIIDDLNYSYVNNSNKLKSVWDNNNDANSILGDFREPVQNNADNRNLGMEDYSYDSNGNLVADKNKGITFVTYNYLNLPEKITFASKGSVEYVYNTEGTRLQKIVTDNTSGQTKKIVSDFINGFMYINDTLNYCSHEEGRVRLVYDQGTEPVYAFDYFLKDHLENIRMVLSDNTQTNTYFASMEAENAAKENALFSNIDATRAPKPAGYPQEQEKKSNKQVARLNAGKNTKIGPSLVLRVMAGDTVSIYGKAFYKSTAPTKNGQDATPEAMTDAIIRTFLGGTNRSVDAHATSDSRLISPFQGNFTANDYTRLKEKAPDNNKYNQMKAYLSFVLFDDRFKIVEENSGMKQVKEEPDQIQQLQQSGMVMKKTGLLYVYSNTETASDVYFDDVTVVHAAGPLVEETHYYPFGLSMGGLSSNALKGTSYKENLFKFNRKELQSKEISDGSGLEWHDYGVRMYDAQIGKWNAIDPLSRLDYNISPYAYTLNNPVRYSDPLGLTAIDNKCCGYSTLVGKEGGVQDERSGGLVGNTNTTPNPGSQNIPFNRIDPADPSRRFDPSKIDGWVNRGGNKMIWDPNVNSKAEARNKYGKGANYVGVQAVRVGDDGQTYYYAANGQVYSSVGLQEVVIHRPQTGGAGAYGPWNPDAAGFQVTLGGNYLFSNSSLTLGVFIDNRGIGFYASPGVGLTSSTGLGGWGASITGFVSEYTGKGIPDPNAFRADAITTSLNGHIFTGFYSQSAAPENDGSVRLSRGYETYGIGLATPSYGVTVEHNYTKMFYLRINK